MPPKNKTQGDSRSETREGSKCKSIHTIPRTKTAGKKKNSLNCGAVEGGTTYLAPPEDMFRLSYFEIFCFPYIACLRIWDWILTICSGSNQCLIYLLIIQYITCKISKLTTPSPLVFPYYFYMYCQVIALTILFYLLWRYWLHEALYIYFKAMADAYTPKKEKADENDTFRMSYRRFCFRKSELFDTDNIDNSYKTQVNHALMINRTPTYVIVLALYVFVRYIF